MRQESVARVMNELNWKQFEAAVNFLAEQLRPYSKGRVIYGEPRGGLCLGVALSHALEIPFTTSRTDSPKPYIWVDDIIDSGKTFEEAKIILPRSTMYAAWCIREKQLDNILCVTYAETVNDDWIVFPWEKKQNAENEKADYEIKRK